MVPIHSTVGTTTFILAITTAIAGITETAFYKLRLVAAVLIRSSGVQTIFQQSGRGLCWTVGHHWAVGEIHQDE